MKLLPLFSKIFTSFLSIIIVTMAGQEQMVSGSNHCEDGPSHYHFVLVHGFGGGAWGWFRVRALLEASGYKVTCLDLKGGGIDITPISEIKSFEDYSQPLIDFLSNHSSTNSNEKVILVGHSSGGLSVTLASHMFSHKIHVAVYLAATMLKHGFTTQQDIIDGVPPQFRSSAEAKVDPFVAPEDQLLSNMLKRSGPLDEIKNAKFTGSRADKVSRVYIKTLRDQVLLKEQQEAMIKRWKPSLVMSIDSDHNPPMYFPLIVSGMLIDAATNIK